MSGMATSVFSPMVSSCHTFLPLRSAVVHYPFHPRMLGRCTSCMMEQMLFVAPDSWVSYPFIPLGPFLALLSKGSWQW